MFQLEFKNPQLMPIDKLVLDSGSERLPALSVQWVEKKRSWTKYVPLKTGMKLQKDVDFDEETWLAENRLFNNDLQYILGLNFHRFWSHVLFDTEFLNPMLHFLQESTPFYIPIRRVAEDNDAVVALYESICQNVLMIVCRLITNRESDAEFMSKEKQAEIIYKNFIISIPMIFDCLTLYGYSNKNLMQKVIETLLKIEPNYSTDLKMGIHFIVTTFESMKKQLEETDAENRDLFERYEDLTLYLMNISTTLNLLISLVPNEVKAYCSRDLRLEQSIANLYDNFIPMLYQFSFAVDSEAWFLTYIDFSRVELINCYRSLLSRGISSILNASEKNRQKFADGVLSTLTESAGYKTFIADYVKLYRIEMDLDVIAQSSRNVDKIKFEFVGDAFKSFQAGSLSSKVTNGYHVESAPDDYDESEGACALPLQKAEHSQFAGASIEDTLQLETSKILELFPNYGVGYIRRLLAFYENSSEKVVAKILEDNLDVSFKTSDEQESFIPPEIPDKVFMATGLERSNIYDGDKFDVLRNDEFAGHVKKNGKFITKREPKTFHELLNDKSHVKNLKERYQSYGLLAEGDDEYDDEYDDSYDVFTETEPKIQMKIHGRMREMLPDSIEVSESEDEEEEQSATASTNKNSLDFCENPEAIRARRDQQYQVKMSKKHPNRPPQQPQQEPKSRDVVGGQKGQGQTKEVLRNRLQKGANKSSGSNHSRKAGSSFKQSRGMF